MVIIKLVKVNVYCSSSDLIPCTRQEGLYFDYLPWSREGRLHQTPHEGIYQRCWDASPSLYLIQDLGGKSTVSFTYFSHRWSWTLMVMVTINGNILCFITCSCLKRCINFLFWKLADDSISMSVWLENSTQWAFLPVLVGAASCLESWLWEWLTFKVIWYQVSHTLQLFISLSHTHLPQKSTTAALLYHERNY